MSDSKFRSEEHPSGIVTFVSREPVILEQPSQQPSVKSKTKLKRYITLKEVIFANFLIAFTFFFD